MCKSDLTSMYMFVLQSAVTVQDILISHILKKKLKKKKLIFDKKSKKKNESAISRQMDAQRKMNACGSFETGHYFCLA